MHIQTHSFTSAITQFHLNKPPFQTLHPTPSSKPGLLLSGIRGKQFSFWQRRNRSVMVSALEDENSNLHVEEKRKVVEHICLLTAKEELSDEEEKDMLDFLYTTQYQMGGIVAISLGHISGQNLGNYTHGVFMRFQRKEDISKFYNNPFYLDVLKDHVKPYCQEIMNVDYESEVEDDILAIFRKGEDFNYGVEFILLIKFSENSLGGAAEDSLASLSRLTIEFPSLIVQATQGPIFNLSSDEYTHVAVIRFRSSQAFQIFLESSEYKNLWSSKFEPIAEKVLSVNYSVDPVSTELMIEGSTEKALLLNDALDFNTRIQMMGVVCGVDTAKTLIP